MLTWHLETQRGGSVTGVDSFQSLVARRVVYESMMVQRREVHSLRILPRHVDALKADFEQCFSSSIHYLGPPAFQEF